MENVILLAHSAEQVSLRSASKNRHILASVGLASERYGSFVQIVFVRRDLLS